MASDFVASVTTHKNGVTTSEELDALRAEFIQELKTLEIREGLQSRITFEARIYTTSGVQVDAFPVVDF